VSDHTDTTLTDAERAELAPFQWAFHLGVAEGRSYEAANALTAVVEAIVAARVAAARAQAAAVIEGFRKQNPMNGDGSNYTIDRILTALVGPDELARFKREHQDQWNAEYLAFRGRVEGADQ